MKKCLKTCKQIQVACPVTECRNWVDYPEDYNCVLETVEKNGALTLRDTAARLGISFVRVKQIEDAALKKISHFFEKESI